MSDIYRSRTMDQMGEGDVGQELRIAGWVENIRDHGGVSFLDLRDMYGEGTPTSQYCVGKPL